MRKYFILFTILIVTLKINAQVVSTIGSSSSFNTPYDVSVDVDGNVFVADLNNCKVKKITPGGVVSTFAGSTKGYLDGVGSSAKFDILSGVVVDVSGNLYVTDKNYIRKITPNGTVSTFAGNATAGYADGTGTLAKFSSPRGIAIDLTGNLYVADPGNSKIRKITASGVVTTLAGSTSGYQDGIGTLAKFNSPVDLSVDSKGNVYVVEFSNKIRKISPSGVVTTFATLNNGYINYGITVDRGNNLFVTTSYHTVWKVDSSANKSLFAGSGATGTSDGAANLASFNTPTGIAADTLGNIYIADQSNWLIRKVTLCNNYFSANINYSGTPYCKSLSTNQAVNISGKGPYLGGVFTSTVGLTINTNTGEINPSTSLPGTYFVTYSKTSNGCSISTTAKVIITNPPTVNINYVGNPFCNNLTAISYPVTLNGNGGFTGGTYSSTSGLSLNTSTGSIIPSYSLPGTYIVTYTTPDSLGCTITSSTQVTITKMPSANISYIGTPFCTSLFTPQPVTISGTSVYLGGTFSSTPGLAIIPSTGEIYPSASTPGTYWVTYSTPASGGCLAGAFTAQAEVTITSLPVVTFDDYPGSPFCKSLTQVYSNFSITGGSWVGGFPGATFSSTPGLSIDANTGNVNPSLSLPGTYTVKLTVPPGNGCSQVVAYAGITILENEDASIFANGTVTNNITIKSGNAVELQLLSSFASDIQWSPSIGQNNTVFPNTTKTYTVSFINSIGCLQSTSITINVLPKPNIGTVSLFTNTKTFELFDTISINVLLKNAVDVYGLFMKLKGNDAVKQYLKYTGYTAGSLFGSNGNIISTPPVVTDNVPDFGIVKIGAVPGYTGTGTFYTFRFIVNNFEIPDSTKFFFYLDDINANNSNGNSCGVTNQGVSSCMFSDKVTVWPGDLNKSKKVTAADLLPIGYFYNSTGDIRLNSSLQWVAQKAKLWGYNHSSAKGDAYKVFADSNGDGIINNSDQTAIGFNMNQFHFRIPKIINNNLQNKSINASGLLILNSNFSEINASTTPQSFVFDVNLNNSGGLNSLYGVAINLLFDSTVFDLNTASVDYNGSIFGNIGSDCLVINYNSTNGVSVALSRFANSPINGQGLLFKVNINTKAILNQSSTYVNAYAEAANNQSGEPLEIQNAQPFYLPIQGLGFNIETYKNIKIYPNPTNNIIYIEGLDNNKSNTIQIFDVQGKLVLTKTINEKGTIDLSELNKGVYVIKVGDVAQRIVKM